MPETDIPTTQRSTDYLEEVLYRYNGRVARYRPILFFCPQQKFGTGKGIKSEVIG